MVLNNLLRVTLVWVTVVSIFTGCSTREVFEPKKLDGEYTAIKQRTKSVVDIASDIALQSDNTVIVPTQELNVTIKPNQRVVGMSDGWVLSSTIDGNLTMTSVDDPTQTKTLTLKNTIAAASVLDDTLAVVFANNVMALYDIPTQELLFKEESGKAIAVDMRIANPRFFHGLVLFATLDGKIVLVNQEAKKVLRRVIVSSEDFFNNIIYFDLMGNKIIAATGYELLSLSQQQLRQKYEIRNIVHNDDTIYINTKQGEVVALTPTLEVIKKVKFPFAHFLGMILDDTTLYILEKEGYMIVMDAKTFTYKIYEVDIDDGFVFVANKRFYIDDQILKLQK